MYQTFLTKKGFTLLEILIVLAILASILGISLQVLQNLYQDSALKAGASEVYGALVSARSDTLSAQNDMVYGVRISTSTVTRFSGVTYTPGNSTNKVYAFEKGVLATSSLIASGTNIIFERLTGQPSATGTIYIRDIQGAGTTTIVIHASGLIEYE